MEYLIIALLVCLGLGGGYLYKKKKFIIPIKTMASINEAPEFQHVVETLTPYCNRLATYAMQEYDARLFPVYQAQQPNFNLCYHVPCQSAQMAQWYSQNPVTSLLQKWITERPGTAEYTKKITELQYYAQVAWNKEKQYNAISNQLQQVVTCVTQQAENLAAKLNTSPSKVESALYEELPYGSMLQQKTLVSMPRYTQIIFYHKENEFSQTNYSVVLTPQLAMQLCQAAIALLKQQCPSHL